MDFSLISVVIILLVLAVLIFHNKRINSEVEQRGIEANAVVSRVKENVTTDSDGMISISHIYYVTFRTMNGQTMEAQLGSGKSVEFRIGRKAWDHDLHEGTNVRIKYLPEKPSFAIRIG